MKQYTYLIIGGGMTADAAVKGIREQDTSGTIGVISAEQDPPYARPPLSKDLWTGDEQLENIWCGTEKKGAELFLNRKAIALDRNQREVTDDQGDVYQYEKMLLATGGVPRQLPFPDDVVLYYRTRQDYLHLRERMETSEHIAVIGGGFIGAEMAAALAQNQKQVTMIFPEAAICTNILPADFAKQLNQYYQKKGIKLVTGRKTSAIEEQGGCLTVHLENGHRFSVDTVLAGIGIEPETQLAKKAGLVIDNGLRVDEYTRTNDAHIYAAGDVANFYNPALEQWMRVEHEDHALTMGATAGRNMAGAKEPYKHLPFFYSDLFDLGYEAVGQTDSKLAVHTDLQDPTEKGCVFYLEETSKRVRGIVFWNIFGLVDAGRELIAAPGPHTPEGLRQWQNERLAT